MIVVVSAHYVTSGGWEVASSAWPSLMHDHPVAELYGERYSPPGDPALASQIMAGCYGDVDCPEGDVCAGAVTPKCGTTTTAGPTSTRTVCPTAGTTTMATARAARCSSTPCP